MLEHSRAGKVAVIDTIPHMLTGTQLLWQLLSLWEGKAEAATILLVPRGKADLTKNKVRVSLSRRRKEKAVVRKFELRFSAAIPFVQRYGDLEVPAEYFVAAKVPGARVTKNMARFDAAANDGGFEI